MLHAGRPLRIRMMNKIATRISGVYQILCKPTGKIYVGGTVNLRARWEQHRRCLRRGNHPNAYLQNAWNKYGEENFEFSILEFASPHHLLKVEQHWIDRSMCANPSIGFNRFALAGSPGETLAQVWEGFVDPAGNEVTITNLHKFCRENGLTFKAMHQLAMGNSKLKSHKGWTHKNSVRQRDYIKTYDGFIDPAGNLVAPITNLAAFAARMGWTTRTW
jgi:group I intron endonuclease